jgi:O-antigen ligase
MAMNTDASAHTIGTLPPLRISLESLRGAMLWLTGLAGAFVFIEPSPYEIVSLAAMIVFAITGLSFRPAIMPLVLLLIVYNIGFMISVVPVLGQGNPAQWVAVSIFMSVTAIFFAALLGTNTEHRLRILLKGYTAAAVVASLAGIVGYFHLLPHADIFLRYERAQGTFNDPNVFGAFLVLPALLALQRILAGRPRDIVRGGALLLLFVVALLLSFSRAAWGQFAGAGALMLMLTFLTSHSSRERMRIVLIAAAGCLVLMLFIVALLSVDQVAALFKERASLDQSYDSGHSGRFGRHALGFLLALDRPFGIGPLQFATIFPEDPHNAYLNAFMSGGWLSGGSYLTIVCITLLIGIRCVFMATPWRNSLIAVYAAFVGVAGESVIIDSDHWRHYFLLLGVVWGLVSASQRYRDGMAVRPHSPPLARLGPAA